MPDRIGLDIELGTRPRAGERTTRRVIPAGGEGLRILVVGDFSGRSSRSAHDPDSLAERDIPSIDLDRFDAVMSRLQPRLRIEGAAPGSPQLEVALSCMDDLHPDALYRALGAFGDLRESRARILDPRTFEQEATALMGQLPAATVGGGDAPQPSASPEKAASFVERLLGTPARSSSSGRAGDIVATLVSQATRPHVVPAPSLPRETFLSAIDKTASERMRRLLHHQDFQALEANWRGLRRLVDALDPDRELDVRIADITRQELEEDLRRSADRVETSGSFTAIAAALAGPAAKPRPTLIALLAEFGREAADVELLERLAAVAAQLGAPLLAGAAPELVGGKRWSLGRTDPSAWRVADETHRRWSALRRSADARWLGLAIPRVLARLPYGARVDSVEAFSFEELAGAHDPEMLLWSSPALACAEALGRAFRDEGAGLDATGPFDLTDLPALVRDEHGEKVLQACAEEYLASRTIDAVLASGLVPVVSFRDRSAVRLPRLQSIAEPWTPLGAG